MINHIGDIDMGWCNQYIWGGGRSCYAMNITILTFFNMKPDITLLFLGGPVANISLILVINIILCNLV